MKTERIKLTPESAKAILNGNKKNRPISTSNVKYLKDEILEGRWKLTHQGICVSKEGNLIDGQHRVIACIESGKTIDIMLTTDAPEENFKYIDTGRKRTPSDILSIEGFRNTNILPGLANKAMIWQDKSTIVRMSHGTIDELIEFVKQNNDRLQKAIHSSVNTKNKFIRASATVFCFYLFDKMDNEKAIQKLESFITGVDIDKYLAKTRNEFIDHVLQKRSIEEQTYITKILHAILCSFKKKFVRINIETTPYEMYDEIVKHKHGI